MGGHKGDVFPDLDRTVRILTLIGSFFLSFGLWLLSYHWLIRPMDASFESKVYSKTNMYTKWLATEELQLSQMMVGKEVDFVTLAQTKADTIYDWFNCNPNFALKCEYYFKDQSGCYLEERRKGHPVACQCGDNEGALVYLFESGKEYFGANIQHKENMDEGIHNALEFETHLEKIARLCRYDLSEYGSYA